MARRIVHQLVDDLDGTVLEVGEGETVLFSLDGAAYEIDLTEHNARALRGALSPFISAGRKISSRTPSTASDARVQRRSDQRDYAPIRAWAVENGFTLSERGRVPAAVLEAYDAAH